MNDIAARSAAALHGDLSPEEHVAFEAELARDPEARALHETLTTMHHLAAAHIQSTRPAGDFESRLIRKFRQRRERPAWRARLSGWLRLPFVYLPATAAVLLGCIQLGAELTHERAILGAPESKPDVGQAVGASIANRRNENDFSRGKALDGLGWDKAPAPAGPPAPAAEPAEAIQPKREDESGRGGFASADGLTSDMLTPADAERQPGAPPAAASPADARKLIRNARVELEVTAFDPAAKVIVDLAAQMGGYLDTRNTTRLPNGKMSGTLVLKVPPAALEPFLARLAPLGEVRNQTLGTEDVTKAYFDSDARLRNARRMEERLLDLLKTTKGRVTDLLAVERELARVREQIEEQQGQLKLWDALASSATVTIQLAEKDLGEAAKYLLRERVALALASSDVTKTFQQARETAANGAQVLESKLTVDGQGRATALLRLQIEPDRAEGIIARLKALGRPLDFRRETDRIARDGRDDAPGARTERDRVQLTLTVTSDRETPVQRTSLRVETPAVDQQAEALRTYAREQRLEIKDSSFEQTPDGRQLARLRLVLPLEKYPALLARLEQAGRTRDLAVQRTDAGQPGTVTDRAEVSVLLATPPELVAADAGLASMLRRTFGQAVGAVMWSARMIGVSLAFLLPWALALGGLFLVVRAALRRRKR